MAISQATIWTSRPSWSFWHGWVKPRFQIVPILYLTLYIIYWGTCLSQTGHCGKWAKQICLENQGSFWPVLVGCFYWPLGHWDSNNVFFLLACTLPPDVGICVGNFRKYFYHHQSRDCKMFVWGGCSGNENRFSSKKECLLRCMMTNVDASSNEIRLGKGKHESKLTILLIWWILLQTIASLDMDLMKEIMATVTDALSAEPLQQPKIPWTMRDIKMRAQWLTDILEKQFAIDSYKYW